MEASLDASLALAATRDLPPEYRWLLPLYPRDTWLAHPNMGAHTRFWLDLHRQFRRAGADLDRLNAMLREDEVPVEAFKGAMARHLQQFLGALEHHHQMEDRVFFPRFMANEPRVAKGIDLLETDHEALDAAIHDTVRDANALLQCDADGLARAGDAYTATSERLVAFMRQHLDDEEEILMPLILDRGEAALGVEG